MKKFLLLLVSIIGFASPVVASEDYVTMRVFSNNASGSITGVYYNHENYILTADHVCDDTTDLIALDKNMRFFYLKVVKVSHRLHVCMLQGDIPLQFNSLSDVDSADGTAYGFPGRIPNTCVKTHLKYLTSTFMPYEKYKVLIPVSIFAGNLYPGMSGGPTLTKDGDVLGINTATDNNGHAILVPASTIAEFLKSYQRETNGR